ncbi:hypothetical protein [Nocardiopsis sp. FR26]|uniref:hypothetical protein n=1 Tax=Nocardiopsis sp. FR26 TaxID=2605987 RepID=UPI00135CCDA2|nr:hypothetical protein [Nocardiopsis sp. FR26]
MTPEQLTRQYIAACHKAYQAYDNRHAELLAEWEAKGFTIVSGGQTGADSWEVTDYRTGKVIARGQNGYDEYLAVSGRDGARWVHYDHATEPLDDHLSHPPHPEDLPDSLCEALALWVDNNPEDAAAFLEF